MLSQMKRKASKEIKKGISTPSMVSMQQIDIFEAVRAIGPTPAVSMSSEQLTLDSPRKLRTPRATLFNMIVRNESERLKSVLDNEEISLSDEIMRKKRTITHWLAYYGRTDMLALLFGKEQINLNVRDSKGRTPLHLAASRGKLSCVRRLVEAGANWEALDDKGQTSFQIAKGDKTKKYLMSLYEPDFPRRDQTVNIPSSDPGWTSNNAGFQLRASSVIHQVGLHDQHNSRRHCPSSIFDAYENGAMDIFGLLLAQNFDFSQPIGETSLTQYVQTHPIHTRNWNLYRQLAHKMHEKLIQANLQFEDAIMLNNFRSYLQQNASSESECSDLDRHLNTVLEGIIKPGQKPVIVNGRYLSEFAHGIVEFYSPFSVFNKIAERFGSLMPLAKLRALYLMKELMMQDTDNRFVGNDVFKIAWKAFKKSIKTNEIMLYHAIMKKLNIIYEAKKDFYMTAVAPLDIEEAPLVLDSLLASINSRKGSDTELVDVLAQDIRQINALYYLCLSPNELRTKSWQAIDKEEVSPNAVKLTKFFDGLAKMVVYDILSLSDIKARARRISFYLDVAFDLVDESKGLPDFHGAHSILSGLANVSISRLKDSWALVDSAHIVQKAKLERIFNPHHNYEKLRSMHEKNGIPFLGLLTRDITFILDSNEPEDAILLLGRAQMKLIQVRMNLLNYPSQIKTDILKYISRLSTVSDEDLYSRSRYLEEHIFVLKPNSPLSSLVDYLKYRREAKLGLKIQLGGKVFKDKQALNPIFGWLKNSVQQQRYTEEESRQVLGICFSLLTPSRDYNLEEYMSNLFSQPVKSRRRASSDSQHSPRVTEDSLHIEIEKVTHQLEEIHLSMPSPSSSSSKEVLGMLPLMAVSSNLRSAGHTPREKKDRKMKQRAFSSTLPKDFGLYQDIDQDNIPPMTTTPRGKL